MGEVRTQREGQLWWVRASGSGTTWATGSAPASGMFGFVTDYNYTSANTTTVIKDRGTPSHKKVTDVAPISLSFSLLWTGAVPTAVSGSGATVPMIHLEHKATGAEAGAAYFHQFHGCDLNNVQFTESMDGNTVQFTTEALAMNGPTASGYLVG